MSNFLDINQLMMGLNRLQLNINDYQIKQIDIYASMLYKWNKVYNLTSITNADEVLTHHIFDSLATVPVFKQYLYKGSSLLDVGSGGGLPAIPIAIIFPDCFVSMVDTVGKKTAFLTQVGVALKLKNLNIYHDRVEYLQSPHFDVISSRAFSSLSNFISLTEHLLKEGGTWIALKGQYPTEEIQGIGSQIKSVIIPISVPYLNEERNVVVMKKI